MFIKKILNRLYSSHKFSKEIDSVKILLGNIISENNKKKNESNISSYEFSIFSQWGDDGIIDYLINNLDIKNKSFIEFGVQDYTECNTKFLLINKNWKGLIIDEAENLINKIYITLINLPYLDEDNEIQERGLGEMGETQDEAERIVMEWVEENKIEII